MTGLGVIGTAAAWLNLRKAKAEYEALKEKQEGLQAVVESYNVNRYDITKDYDTKPNEMPDGVEYGAILRVANVVGKMFYAKVSLVLTNTSDKTYYIRYAEVDTFFDKLPIIIHRLDWDGIFPSGSHQVPQSVLVDKQIKPGETLEIEFQKGLSALPAENMDALRELILTASGYKVITSIRQPLSIIDGITSDIKLGWTTEYGNELKDGYTLGKIGVLRYCMELSLINE